MNDHLLLDFDAFFLEHRCCRDLDGGTSNESVWLVCVACGARSERAVGRRDTRRSVLAMVAVIGRSA